MPAAPVFSFPRFRPRALVAAALLFMPSGETAYHVVFARLVQDLAKS